VEIDDPTPVDLTGAEALVPFDWLHQLEDADDSVTQDKATQVGPLGAVRKPGERTC